MLQDSHLIITAAAAGAAADVCTPERLAFPGYKK